MRRGGQGSSRRCQWLPCRAFQCHDRFQAARPRLVSVVRCGVLARREQERVGDVPVHDGRQLPSILSADGADATRARISWAEAFLDFARAVKRSNVNMPWRRGVVIS